MIAIRLAFSRAPVRQARMDDGLFGSPIGTSTTQSSCRGLSWAKSRDASDPWGGAPATGGGNGGWTGLGRLTGLAGAGGGRDAGTSRDPLSKFMTRSVSEMASIWRSGSEPSATSASEIR